jgi:hypothetical protein
MIGKKKREASMRIKPDGTVDEVWREPETPWWGSVRSQGSLPRVPPADRFSGLF